jgi:chromosome segregation ATPase
MFTLDILIALSLMALLFLRQLMVFKNLNKINYAPLMLGLGALSSLAHFMVYSQTLDTLLLMRDSLFPFVVSLFFYMITNILHQTHQTQQHREEFEAMQALFQEINDLKEHVGSLETKILYTQQEEQKLQENSRENLKHEVRILDTLTANHTYLAQKFETLMQWHEDVTLSFDNFTNVQMPQFDDVVHKHIDVLRITEQEHFNKLADAIHAALAERLDFAEEFANIKDDFLAIKNVSHTIAESIIKESSASLLGVTKVLENQFTTLKSHAQALDTTLYEAENRLSNIKNHSEMIMKQMALSSKKMSELQEKNSSLQNFSHTLHELLGDVETVRSSYIQSKIELHSMINDMHQSHQEHLHAMNQAFETLREGIDTKIEDSLSKLHEEYREVSHSVTQNVKVLAKKAQLQKGYQQLD